MGTKQQPSRTTSTVNYGRIVITTDANKLKYNEDLVQVLDQMVEDADLVGVAKKHGGSKLATKFSATFEGEERVAAARAKQLMASRLKHGMWVPTVVKALEAGGGMVKVFLNPDRDSTQRRGDYAWRLLKRNVAAIKGHGVHGRRAGPHGDR